MLPSNIIKLTEDLLYELDWTNHNRAEVDFCMTALRKAIKTYKLEKANA